MNSRIRYNFTVYLSFVLVISGLLIVIHLSTATKLFAQSGVTNASTTIKKSASSIQVPKSVSNATAEKIGNLSHLSTKPEIPVYIVSNIGTTTFHYLPDPDFSNLYHECPEEVVILVHGLSITSPSVIRSLEEYDRAAISIESNHYYFPIIGFLWSSNPDANLDTTALKAGNALGGFLTDFKDHCKSTTLRIVAHSIGTKVVSNAILALNSSPRWTDNSYKIESVHFLGSSLSPEDPGKDSTFGGFIENYVGHFYNLFSPHDDKLSIFGSLLGNTGASRKIITPANYLDMDVAKEIVNPLTMHEDHLAYWGLRDKYNHVIDDGAMDVVVSNWSKESPLYGGIIDFPTNSSGISNATVIHG